VGSLDEVADAARRAGLDFVVLGDHPGDWTAAGPAALRPARLGGVLVVGGLELVIEEVGRVLVTGLDTLPRSWQGDVGSLLERVPDGGGFVSIVHPRSPRGRERWKVPGTESVHAWEVLDISEMARVRLADRWAGYHLGSFLSALLIGRAHESLLRLGREGVAAPGLLAYDSMRAAGPLTLTAGLNHHPKARALGRPFPAYGPFFRTMVNQVLVDSGPHDDPAREWTLVADALRRGRSFVSLGGARRAEGFDVAAAAPDGVRVEMGGVGPWSLGTTLRIDLPADAGPLLVRILREGVEEAWLSAPAASAVAWPAPGPGIYRVEVHRAGLRLGPFRWNRRAWLLANPIELYGGADRTAAAGEGGGEPPRGGVAGSQR
jgi:hypothetical protein